MSVTKIRQSKDKVTDFFRHSYKRAGDQRLRESAVLELVRQHEVSAAKGAELLGLYIGDFVDLMASHDIPYFTESPHSMKKLRTLMKRL